MWVIILGRLVTQLHNLWIIEADILLLSACSQGGLYKTSTAKEWEEVALPISFPSTAILHLTAGLTRICYSTGVTGATVTGHSDRDYLSISSEFQPMNVRWYVMGR